MQIAVTDRPAEEGADCGDDPEHADAEHPVTANESLEVERAQIAAAGRRSGPRYRSRRANRSRVTWSAHRGARRFRRARRGFSRRAGELASDRSHFSRQRRDHLLDSGETSLETWGRAHVCSWLTPRGRPQPPKFEVSRSIYWQTAPHAVTQE